MNSPMVGRNLLGDQAYNAFRERLADQGKVMLVMSRGVYPHISPDFVPGSTPSRIGLNQGQLAIETRDLNWLEPGQAIAAQGAPAMDAMNLFRVGGNAAFCAVAEAGFHAYVSLPRKHLVSDSARFTMRVTFAGELFETVELEPDPQQGRARVCVAMWKEG